MEAVRWELQLKTLKSPTVDQGHSDPKKQPKPSSPYLKYSQLGIQLVLTIGLAAWGGYALDKYLGLKFPAFLLAFVLLSFGGSMWWLLRSLND
ncbi:MAG: AtpZ/AtpI family protein [Bacteroidota bacterium]